MLQEFIHTDEQCQWLMDQMKLQFGLDEHETWAFLDFYDDKASWFDLFTFRSIPATEKIQRKNTSWKNIIKNQDIMSFVYQSVRTMGDIVEHLAEKYQTDPHDRPNFNQAVYNRINKMVRLGLLRKNGRKIFNIKDFSI